MHIKKRKVRFKKALSLLIVITFAITTIVQAAPYSIPDTSHLRPAAAINSTTSNDIKDGITSFPARDADLDSYREREIEELWSKPINDPEDLIYYGLDDERSKSIFEENKGDQFENKLYVGIPQLQYQGEPFGFSLR